MANLAAAFASLPEEIKDWIGSSEVTDLIIDLSEDFELNEEQIPVVSRAIMRLVTQDLGPRDFISELTNQLQIDKDKAKSIAEKITSDVLSPIEEDLKKSGVDIGLIIEYSRESAPQTPLQQTTPEVAPPENLPAPPQRPKPMLPDKPLILHQEEDVESAGQENFSSKPSFRYTEPGAAQTEEQPETKIEGLRVVHYSSFLTPFNQSNIGQNKANIPVPKSKWFVG